MAKDPAFLFYPGDYISGTMHLDFECKGAYVDLLMLQFNKDHMTIHMIKQVLGHKFDHIWPLIIDKFRERDGKYWNERLRIEKEKRIRFTKSRSDNRNSKKDKIQHMSQHMEDVNNGISITGIWRVDKNQMLPGQTLEAVERNQFTMTKSKNTDFINSQWGTFVLERLSEPDDVWKREYPNLNELTKYFINWMRNKFPKKDNGIHSPFDDEVSRARASFKPIQEQ